jgi:hypothetical protein
MAEAMDPNMDRKKLAYGGRGWMRQEKNRPLIGRGRFFGLPGTCMDEFLVPEPEPHSSMRIGWFSPPLDANLDAKKFA